MKIVTAQNVNDAYVSGMMLLNQFGSVRNSRNGPVLVCPEPVTTHYAHPRQRVLFNRQRDANPFFHLFEALWMLTGSSDVEFPAYFVPRMRDFSDNGKTFNAAYGRRWRHFREDTDQLVTIIQLLKNNPEDRRIILQMWDVDKDLGAPTLDAACNVTAKFEIRDRSLNMMVFNRSNDIIMGCYGANAVHFSILQEYIAANVNAEVGWYEQISTDFHAYMDKSWDKYWPITPSILQDPDWYDSDTESGVVIEPLIAHPRKFDIECLYVVDAIRSSRTVHEDVSREFYNPFLHIVCQPMSVAYAQYRDGLLLDALHTMDVAIESTRNIDWLVAGKRWLQKRHASRSEFA